MVAGGESHPELVEHVLQAEADLAAALFVELCTYVRDAAAKQGKPVAQPSVGVVTPYRCAAGTLRDTAYVPGQHECVPCSC